MPFCPFTCVSCGKKKTEVVPQSDIVASQETSLYVRHLSAPCSLRAATVDLARTEKRVLYLVNYKKVRGLRLTRVSQTLQT